MKILVVEDEQKIAQFLKKGLAEKGYAVEAVGDADAALERLEAMSFDLIILDLLLPAFRELLARLRALLRRTEAPEPGPLTWGDLAYDPEAREVVRGSEVIRLTAREGALFELLLRRRGRVVPRSEIQARIWEDAYDLSTNIIDVYINALRKKIDASGQEKIIQTVRGVGYRVREPGSAETP